MLAVCRDSFLMVREAKCNQVLFPLERMSWHAPDLWTPKHFTDNVSLNIHSNYLPPARAQVSY